MSTRSEIGIYNHEENTLSYAYCHFDGYYAGVGKTLINNIQTTEQAKDLISKGDFSYLNEDGTVGQHYPESEKPHTKQLLNWKECQKMIEERLEQTERDYIYIWHTKEKKWYSAHGKYFQLHGEMNQKVEYVLHIEWKTGASLENAIKAQEEYFDKLD